MGLHGLGEAVEEMIDKLFSVTDEVCETHDVNLVQRNEEHSFCPVCSLEKIRKTEQEILDEETKLAYNHKKRWLRQRSIVVDKSMFDMTFENFREVDEETKINKEKALNVARKHYKGFKDNSLLAGRFGTGKTHLSMAILNQLNEHADMRLLFVSVDELMRRIKSSFGNPESPFTEDRVIALLSKADLLVMDDMGAEVGSFERGSAASDYTIRVINGVLNGRTSKPTIFTTNLSIKELERVYDGRIMSRMFRGVEQEDIIQFKTTPDKRTKLKF